MPPDQANQSGPADTGGVHHRSGEASADQDAGRSDGAVENHAAPPLEVAAEGLAGGSPGQNEAAESSGRVRPDDGSGEGSYGHAAGLGEGGPGDEGGVHSGVRDGEDEGGSEGDSGSEGDPKKDGRQAARGRSPRPNITARDVASALKCTDPDWSIFKRVDVVAAALGCSRGFICGVIDKDPQLRAAYGSTGKLVPRQVPRAPTQAEVMDRDADELPRGALPSEKQGVDLIELVDEAERDLHMKGLEAIGVNEETLGKLRKLSGLATSTGAFIAIGLENTHRLYYLAVVDLKTVADQIKTRYLDDPKAVSDSDRPYYYRNYIDAVKEFGRAYDLFIQGAAIILRIVGQGAEDSEEKKPKRAKLGFTGRSMKQAQAPSTAAK